MRAPIREAPIDFAAFLSWGGDQAQQTARALGAAYLALAAPAAAFAVFGFVRRRGHIGPWRAYTEEARVSLAMVAANVLLAAPVMALVAGALNAATLATGVRLVDPAIWHAAPPLVVYACAILAGDFVGYWRHRIEHSRLLWPSHAIHHSDSAMTWLTLERFHPINTVTTYAIDTAALVALGFPLEAIIANGVVRHWYGYWIHMDAPWTYGLLGRVFVSPAMHGWHHAADPRAYGSNFATVFSVWDQMFGTYRVPGPRPAEMGVAGLTGTSALAHLAHPARPAAYRPGYGVATATEPNPAGAPGGRRADLP